MARRYLAFFAEAKTIYNIHSPFVYAFVENVLEDQRQYYAFSGIEALRKKLYADKNLISVTDFGAGSRVNNDKQRTIRDIAKSAVSGSWKCQLLFRMILYFKPKTILELGTSLGISTLYLSMADGRSQIYTLEGCPNISAVAKRNFSLFKRKNIILKTGPFSQTLSTILETAQPLDFIFIDGHHSQEATIQYFQQCLPYCHKDTVLVFDDIYWSEGMQQAWLEIKQNSRVTLSIDLFFMGLVFFQEGRQEKEAFALVQKKWKPWNMGFFR